MKTSNKFSIFFILLSASSFSYSSDDKPVRGVDYDYYYNDNGHIAYKSSTDDGSISAGAKDVRSENLAIDISEDYTNKSAEKTLNQAVTYTDNQLDQKVAYTDSQISTTNSRIDSLNDKIDDNRKQASAGIAGAMAMSSIPQNLSYDFNFGMGLANFDSEQAISAGGYYRVNERTTVSLKTSFDTQNNLGAAAGISYGW
ncbi:YadA C-terminal domain-containing protein [Salmonella enterica subsp. enterica]|nr:hypothetical protein [Salmonella enterica subsp. enterica serovar Nigeria]ECG8305588.1 hypothetical protein [Salmonella enterica subsp. enterica serovar Glostrup]ECG9331106.1 hypothetical protein [Salmonella enterica]EEE8158208.1 hypothetical protein [Salmonella enterica subsp. enterica serovar Badagry]EIN7308260.1 YadA C-terminal domain-containing protein [Salmonella enterica subsp. enterica serovar Telelkebir]